MDQNQIATEQPLNQVNAIHNFYRDASTEETKIDALIEEPNPRFRCSNISIDTAQLNITHPETTQAQNARDNDANANDVILRSDFFMLASIRRGTRFYHPKFKAVAMNLITFFNGILHTSFKINKIFAVYVIKIILVVADVVLLCTDEGYRQNTTTTSHAVFGVTVAISLLYIVSSIFQYKLIYKKYEPLQRLNMSAHNAKLSTVLHIVCYVTLLTLFILSIIFRAANQPYCIIFILSGVFSITLLLEVYFGYSLCIIIFISTLLLILCIFISVFFLLVGLSIFILIYMLVRTYKANKAALREYRALSAELDRRKRLPLPNDCMENCSICLGGHEIQEMVLKLACQHVFHYECIKSWVDAHSKNPSLHICPNCRKPIKLVM